MSLVAIGWLFTFGVLAHNTEEALHLPAWSAHAGKWHARVDAAEFRFAVAALSVLLVVVAAAASLASAGSVSAYLMAGYVLAMVLNVLMPHVLVTVVMRKYMPGTARAAPESSAGRSLSAPGAFGAEHSARRVRLVRPLDGAVHRGVDPGTVCARPQAVSTCCLVMVGLMQKLQPGISVERTHHGGARRCACAQITTIV